MHADLFRPTLSADLAEKVGSADPRLLQVEPVAISLDLSQQPRQHREEDLREAGVPVAPRQVTQVVGEEGALEVGDGGLSHGASAVTAQPGHACCCCVC